MHIRTLSAEEEKIRKCNSAAEAHRASFTPFVVSTDGILGREASFLLKRLAQSISIKWDKPLGQTTGWLRAKLSFAILRATNLCLRGSGEVELEWMMVLGYLQNYQNLIHTFVSFHFVAVFLHVMSLYCDSSPGIVFSLF